MSKYTLAQTVAQYYSAIESTANSKQTQTQFDMFLA